MTNSIGEILKNARQKKQLTINDIVNQTNIRSAYLKAIEEDRFEDLPEGDTYRKAFLKNYAESVGVDKQEVLNLYNGLFSAAKPLEKIIEPQKDNPLPAAPAAPKMNLNKIPAIKIAAAFLAVILFWFIYHSGNKPAKTVSVKTETKTLKAAAISQDRRAVSVNNLPASKLLVLKARALKDVDVKIKIDGGEFVKTSLKKEESKEWRAQEKFTLTIPDAGSIEWSLDGKNPYILGKSGQFLENIVITRS